jgi:hypothetical protein
MNKNGPISPPHPTPHPQPTPHPTPHPQPTPPAPTGPTAAEIQAHQVTALRQLAAQYQAQVRSGKKQTFQQFLTDETTTYMKDHPTPPEEPGLVSEGLGPIGWVLLGVDAWEDAGVAIGSLVMEKLIDKIIDSYQQQNVDHPNTVNDVDTSGENPDGGVGDGGGGCFTAGTLVTTPDGRLAIEQLRVGDRVLARDEQSRVLRAEPIEHVWFHERKRTARVRLDTGETIETTAKHRVYVEGRGFVGVESLHVGDRIATRAGEAAQVEEIEVGPECDVYNLEVANAHTYFVGRSELWVHNAKVSDPDGGDDGGDDDDDED